MRRRGYLGIVTGAAATALAGCGGDSTDDGSTVDSTPTASVDLPFEREIDPSRTYLRTSGDDAGDAEPIDLGALGVQSGMTLRLERLGSFTGSSGGTGMTGVFAGSATLRSADQQNRLPDAIDAGDDFETSATYNGGRETDIPEDFLIADNEGSEKSVTVTVPDGATHLFVAAIDNLYEDNAPADPPFAVRLEQA